MRRIHVGIIIRNFIRDFPENAAIKRKYRSWASASRAVKTGYQAEFLTSFRIERSRGILGKEEEYVNVPHGLHPIMADGSGVFVDFGGSAGELCAVLQRMSPKWSFTVVETPAMVKTAAAIRPAIAFSDALPEGISIFYSSGTLQYLQDPYVIWAEALRKTTGHAFLARNAFSERECFRVQHSMLFNNGAGPIPDGFQDAGVRYPHRTISERRITEIASDVGFELIGRSPDRNDGLIQGMKDMYGADLLFKRR